MPEAVTSGQRAAGARGRPVAALVLLGSLAAATYSAVVLVDHASQDVYGIPGWGVGLTLGLLALNLLGCGLVVWSRLVAFGAVVLGAASFAVLGFLALFSFGLIAVLVAAGLLAWAAGARWSGPRRVPAAVGAVLAGACLPLLLIFGTGGPLVECGADGSSSEENFFMAVMSAGGSGVSDSATSGPNGSDSGHGEGGAYEYSYVCRAGRLVRFDLRWR